MIFNIPARGKYSNVIGRHFFDVFSNHFVLIVEGLDWPWDEVITANDFFLVLLIFLIFLPNLSIFFGIGGGGEVEGKNGGSFFK